MVQGRIVIITGCPGTGKTTISSQLAKNSTLNKSVHMHTDDFYHFLSKGYIPPYLPESNEQNQIVIEAFLEAAKRFVRGGYDVIVDGVIGPWFIEPWEKCAREGYEVHYIVARADKDTTLKRAVERAKMDEETNIEIVEIMWEQFSDLGIYEKHVVTTTGLAVEETIDAVRKIVKEKKSVLKNVIKTERLLLRPWEESDAESLYKYASDPDIGLNAAWPPHKSVENSLEIIRTVFSVPETYAVCLKETNEAIGCIGLVMNTALSDKDDECEVGCWIGKPYWGQGMIPEALRALIQHAFEDLGMNKIWYSHHQNNDRSKRVREKLGFTYQYTREGVVREELNEVRTTLVASLDKEIWTEKK